MLLERIEIAVRPGQEADFESAMLDVRQRVFSSPGFRGFTVHQGVEFPGTYQVQVLWESPEELLAFAESRFELAWDPVQPFLAGPLRVNHFEERPALGMNGPGVVTDMAWLRD